MDITQNPLIIGGAILAILYLYPKLMQKKDKTFSELGRDRLSTLINFVESSNVSRVILPANGGEPPKHLKGFRAGWTNLNLMLEFSKEDVILEIDRDAISELGRGVWAIKDGAVLTSETNNVFFIAVPKTEERTDREGGRYLVDKTPISNYRLNMNSELEFKKFDLTFNKLAKLSEAEPGPHMESERMKSEEKRRRGVMDT